MSCKLGTAWFDCLCENCLAYRAGSDPGRDPLNAPQESEPAPVDPDFYRWVLEVEVHKTWVADGFDLKDPHGFMMRALPHAYGHELKAKVTVRRWCSRCWRRPTASALRLEQGYPASDKSAICKLDALAATEPGKAGRAERDALLKPCGNCRHAQGDHGERGCFKQSEHGSGCCTCGAFVG